MVRLQQTQHGIAPVGMKRVSTNPIHLHGQPMLSAGHVRRRLSWAVRGAVVFTRSLSTGTGQVATSQCAMRNAGKDGIPNAGMVYRLQYDANGVCQLHGCFLDLLSQFLKHSSSACHASEHDTTMRPDTNSGDD